jgi:opacity protein-like surface antigen
MIKENEMKLGKIIVALLLVMVSTTSYAAKRYSNDDYDLRSTSNFHVGVGVGSMKTDIENADGRSVAWSLFVGTEINRFLAAEISYTNFGSITDLGEDLKGAAYSVSVVGNIPVTSSVSMFAKFGLANTGVYRESATDTDRTYTKFAPTFGLGVRAGVTKWMDVRIAYDNYKFTDRIPGNLTDTFNADITSISLLYKF